MPLNLGQTNSWNSARSWRLLGTANVSLHNFSNLDYYQFTSHIHGTFGFSFHSCNEMSPWLPEFRAQTQPCKYNFTNIKKVFFFFFFCCCGLCLQSRSSSRLLCDTHWTRHPTTKSEVLESQSMPSGNPQWVQLFKRQLSIAFTFSFWVAVSIAYVAYGLLFFFFYFPIFQGPISALYKKKIMASIVIYWTYSGVRILKVWKILAHNHL